MDILTFIQTHCSFLTICLIYVYFVKKRSSQFNWFLFLNNEFHGILKFMNFLYFINFNEFYQFNIY